MKPELEQRIKDALVLFCMFHDVPPSVAVPFAKQIVEEHREKRRPASSGAANMFAAACGWSDYPRKKNFLMGDLRRAGIIR